MNLPGSEPKTVHKRHTSKLALVSFTCGVTSVAVNPFVMSPVFVGKSLGITFLAWFFSVVVSIAGLTVSIIAIRKVRRSIDLKGVGWAVVGLLSSGWTVFGLLVMILYILVAGD